MIEAFSLSCFSLDETQADRSKSNNDISKVDTPHHNENSVFFQNPRTLGRGVDTFDANGFPTTPVLGGVSAMPSDSHTAPEAPEYFDLDGTATPPLVGTFAVEGFEHNCVESSAASTSTSAVSVHFAAPFLTAAEGGGGGRAASAAFGSKRQQAKMVLVRGGTSFTGAHITVKLLQQGFNVRLLAKECNPATTRQLKELARSALSSCSSSGSNSLYIFRGDDLSEALVGCDFVVCNSDPDTGDVSSFDEILKRYMDDVQDLFLSIHSVCGIGVDDDVGGASTTAHMHSVGQPSAAIAAAGYSLGGSIPPNSLVASRIRVVWISTAAAAFPVETTSRTRERTVIKVKSIVMKEAERIARRTGTPLVVLLPSVVVGKPLTEAKCEAHYMISKIAQGNRYTVFAPKMRWNFVDVADVADAVAAALVCEAAAGQRYILSDCEMSISEVGRLVKAYFPALHPPTRDLPNAITLMLCFAGLLGERVSYRYLKGNLSRSFVLSNRKAHRDLHLDFRPAQRAVLDTVAVMLSCTPVEDETVVTISRPRFNRPSALSASSSGSNLDRSAGSSPNTKGTERWQGASSTSSSSTSSSPSRLTSARLLTRWQSEIVGVTAVMAASLGFGYWLGRRW